MESAASICLFLGEGNVFCLLSSFTFIFYPFLSFMFLVAPFIFYHFPLAGWNPIMQKQQKKRNEQTNKQTKKILKQKEISARLLNSAAAMALASTGPNSAMAGLNASTLATNWTVSYVRLASSIPSQIIYRYVTRYWQKKMYFIKEKLKKKR